MTKQDKPAAKPKSIFLFKNGMVACCDQHGQQIPEMQGPFWVAFPVICKADLSELEVFKAMDIDISVMREVWNNRLATEKSNEPGGSRRHLGRSAPQGMGAHTNHSCLPRRNRGGAY